MLQQFPMSRCPSLLKAPIAFAAIVICAMALSASVQAGSLVGQAAPRFSLPNVSTGASTSLASLKHGNKAVVLIFISTRCPVSNAYDQRMEYLASSYQHKAVAIAGINSNVTEPTAEVADHAKTNKFSFVVLKDADSKIADAYGASHTPEAYVIDSQGVVVYHGRIDDNMDASGVHSKDLAAAIDDVLAGKPVATSETKAFGCSIKRPVQ